MLSSQFFFQKLCKFLYKNIFHAKIIDFKNLNFHLNQLKIEL